MAKLEHELKNAQGRFNCISGFVGYEVKMEIDGEERICCSGAFKGKSR